MNSSYLDCILLELDMDSSYLYLFDIFMHRFTGYINVKHVKN